VASLIDKVGLRVLPLLWLLASLLGCFGCCCPTPHPHPHPQLDPRTKPRPETHPTRTNTPNPHHPPKIPNLGGLARTAEIFGASGLVLSDARTASDPGFLSTSVTAERWVPIIEVGEAALVPWLLNRRAEG
jgi:hypothetical protein